MRTHNGGSSKSRSLLALAALLAVLSILAFACAARPQGGAPLPPRVSGPTGVGTGGESTPAAPRRTGSLPRPPVRALPSSPPVRLEIPAISLDTPLMRLGPGSDGTMAVPPGAFPAGWFTGSPTPGSAGPAVIAGHVTYNGPGVFFRLGQLRPGDRVRVTRRDGRTAVFSVTAVREYPKDVFPTAAVYGYTPHPELRLITCSGDYDRAHHHYADNLVVYARMLSAP